MVPYESKLCTEEDIAPGRVGVATGEKREHYRLLTKSKPHDT